MKFSIRDMRPGDWEQVAAIFGQGIDTNIATFQTAVPTYQEWDAQHCHECRFVIVDAVSDQVAGWAALSPASGREVYDGVRGLSIYIHSDYQGMNLGERLLLYLIELSEKHGIWTLESSVMECNKASLRLHDKCGFRQVGFRERVARDRFGYWRTTVLLERRSTLPALYEQPDENDDEEDT